MSDERGDAPKEEGAQEQTADKGKEKRVPTYFFPNFLLPCRLPELVLQCPLRSIKAIEITKKRLETPVWREFSFGRILLGSPQFCFWVIMVCYRPDRIR